MRPVIRSYATGDNLPGISKTHEFLIQRTAPDKQSFECRNLVSDTELYTHSGITISLLKTSCEYGEYVCVVSWALSQIPLRAE